MLWKQHPPNQWEPAECARLLHQTPAPSWSLPTPLFSLIYFSILGYLSIPKRHSPAADTSAGTLQHPSHVRWLGWDTFWCAQAHTALCQQPGLDVPRFSSQNLDPPTLPDQESTQRLHPKPHGKSRGKMFSSWDVLKAESSTRVTPEICPSCHP